MLLLKNIKTILQKLNRLLDRKQKFYLAILLVLSILLSVVETAGVSVVMPFISAASNPDTLNSGWYKYIFNLFGFDDKNSFVEAVGKIYKTLMGWYSLPYYGPL
ncbi:MAG: hypothetical protein LBE17_06610 [Treponema sp.]|jgi:hypothetical protein|nr:hypothetical protein [Treponema sp.]